MPIDPNKLLAFKIPEVRQKITAENAAFYALTIGLGQDALDRRQLDFVCADAPAFRPFPSLFLVVAHPGFWLADPESGVDPRAVLHASQSLRLMAPLPVGDTVVSRSRITRLIDKGEGKAALLDTQTLIEDERGTLLAQLDRTTFVRGGGGFGGDNPAPAPTPARPAADSAPDHVVTLTTRPEQALYYRMNGDANPLHSDPEAAAKAGFERPILHGLCTAGIVCHALLRAAADYDAARLSSLTMRFSGYVLPGESIVTEIWNDGRFRARVSERNATVIEDGYADILAKNEQPAT